jgi:antagonist of KipI
MSLRVLSAGLLTSVQDSGRHGYADLGVGAAGAMDCVALRLANILVGNVENAAGLEFTLRGPRLRLDSTCLIAITGAAIEVRCADAPVPMWRPVLVSADAELDFGVIRRGARAYFAISGGIDTAPLLDSRSADLNAGIGGHALAAGGTLPIQAAPRGLCASLHDTVDGAAFAAAKWSLDPAPWLDGDPTIAVTAGTHLPQLDRHSREVLFNTTFRIGADSNRVGYRLEGASLALGEPLELVSSGVVPGTVQLPPGGAPIVLMAEAPTAGGYPRIAHVIATDLPRLAQRRPGDNVRFTEISLAAAQTRYLERERALATLTRSINERLHEAHAH